MPTLRYFAAAAEAAGTDQELVAASDVAGALAVAVQRHGPRLAHVVQHSSLLLDGRYVTDRGTALADADVVEVLPPFAGG
ncbi:MoaD/ThiS family protein [Ornithinimicrobium sediminis]|uniref:MoaD/ThiS family protein n=1 Tax=Ornithinimicrobium sediminis TaxID=2904603 RepID=UPI001E456DD2|nr:MoaD/ThiS family protein [Ornithinimicrobium sediminis]MCE0487124.1 MoaD/ThiS family protein [Ornithinimicrobium sediminis]